MYLKEELNLAVSVSFKLSLSIIMDYLYTTQCTYNVLINITLESTKFVNCYFSVGILLCRCQASRHFSKIPGVVSPMVQVFQILKKLHHIANVLERNVYEIVYCNIDIHIKDTSKNLSTMKVHPWQLVRITN